MPNPEPSQNRAILINGGGYAALHAQQAAAAGRGIPKKRGRPVGWRKWMQKGPSVTSTNSSVSRVHPKQGSRNPIPDPRYHIYKCEWRQCKAKLHNMATLENHVDIIHARSCSDGYFECHWADCEDLTLDDSDTLVRMRFSSHTAWTQHLKSSHLLPIAWRYGDGPTSGIPVADFRLEDETESSTMMGYITPNVSMYQYSSDSRLAQTSSALLPTNKRGNAKRRAEYEARKEQWEAQQRRQRIGAGIDIEGSFEISEIQANGLIDDAMENRIIYELDGS